MGIAIGEIGLSYDDFCRLSPEEFGHIYSAYCKKMETEHQEVWEQTRMLALYCVAPYSKKVLKPQDLFRFPWESNTGTTAKKKQLSKKEHLEVFEKWCKKLEGS